MSAFFYNGIPNYYMQGFRAVRGTLDNLFNVLQAIEIVNCCQNYMIEPSDKDFDFDLAVFTGDYHRFLIKKEDGYFSMAIPFQVVIELGNVSFNSNFLSEKVGGQLISIFKNAIATVNDLHHSHDEVVLSLVDNFSLEFKDALNYYDAFTSLLADDHGYFRFDDDVEHENGHIHPRYHFDIFYKNTSSIKIGYVKHDRLDCFYSLVDKNIPKRYLAEASQLF
ncbi:conserved hypothetical protein [Aeromonas veronii]|uniref:Uncharacterized protein n=1 Tax=Aeromonas veronii TaxID=654 RepID=A0A653LAX8_AERVE|nr:hypothetical protein [Aeromonas veronii]VXA88424.1 conserved hypothetical protein [Aeromonas veronii]